MSASRDIIAACATASGRGAIGIIRISAPRLQDFIARLLPTQPEPRLASLQVVRDGGGDELDEVLAIYFPAPHSYTGEDMLELQGHGNPLIQDRLLQHLCELGARPAAPGEFSERAFLNGKMDLAQAEAVADLINASSAAAVRGAMRSLKGDFSEQVHKLSKGLIAVRVQLEGGLDFPAEELETASFQSQSDEISKLLEQLEQLRARASSSVTLGEGLEVALVGPPNTGKSSLFNALAKRDLSIVSDSSGTTRDIVHCRLQMQETTLELTDTAGLHSSTDDGIEREGMKRALARAGEADLVLFVCDIHNPKAAMPAIPELQQGIQTLRVLNKIDLCAAGWQAPPDVIAVSAHSGDGLPELRCAITKMAGAGEGAEGDFLARRRHLEQLRHAENSLCDAHKSMVDCVPEMAAGQLRDAQNALGTITGTVSSDDLLGEIFATFCIGK